MLICISIGILIQFSYGNYALFEVWNLTKIKDTSETFRQRNSTETAQQNYSWNFVVMKDIMCRYAFVQEMLIWFFKERSKSLLNFGQNYIVQLRWKWFSVRLPVTNALELLFVVYSILKQCWSVGYVSLVNLSFISYKEYFFRVRRLKVEKDLLY